MRIDECLLVLMRDLEQLFVIYVLLLDFVKMVLKQEAKLLCEILLLETIDARFVHEGDELRGGSFVDLHDEEAERVSHHVILGARFPDDLEKVTLLEVKEAYLTLDDKLQVIVLDLRPVCHDLLIVGAFEVCLDIGVVAAQEVGKHADIISKLNEQ